MTNLEKIVFKVTCGNKSTGTAFLISENLALTAYHVISDNKDNENIELSNSLGIKYKAIIRTDIDSKYKELDIALLELATSISQDTEINFVDFSLIPPGSKWQSRGYPAAKNTDGDNINIHDDHIVNQQLSVLRNKKIDIELQHNKKLISYRGYSGAPLIINNAIAGIILTELSENGESVELNAQSVKYFVEILQNEGINTTKSTSPETYENCISLRNYSKNIIKNLSFKIGGKVSINRNKLKKHILEKYNTNNFIVLNGESGSGKSVLAKSLCDNEYNERSIWLDNQIFESGNINDIYKKLKIKEINKDLTSEISDKKYIIVFDGLERLYSETGFMLAAQLLQLLTDDDSNIKILLTCQLNHWERIQVSLHQHFSDITKAEIVTINNFDSNELKLIANEFPQFKKMFGTPKLLDMLKRPKIIDFFARHTQLPNIDQWTSEANLINWYWTTEVSQKSNGAAREVFITSLAAKLGDTLQSSIRARELSQDLNILQDLEEDGICIRKESKISFSHDLLADWFKQRALLDYIDDNPEFCFSKLNLPSWYRAITLLGLHLLEKGEPYTEWVGLLKLAQQKKEASFTCDLLLESIIYTSQPSKIIASLWPLLINNEYNLFSTLIKRFLFVATKPDPFILLLAEKSKIDLLTASTLNRRPIDILWPDILKIIIIKKDELINGAAVTIGKICKTWLQGSPKGSIYRNELSEIASNMAWKYINQEGTYSDSWDWLRKEDQDPDFFYEIALHAIHEKPENFINLAYHASGLTQPITSHKLNTSEKDNIAEVSKKTQTGLFFLDEMVHLDPIKDGPISPINSDFQNFFFKKKNNSIFTYLHPKEAADITLALCIREGGESYINYNSSADNNYNLTRNFNVTNPLFDKGPFLDLLMQSPDNGLSVILRLTEIATNQWFEENKNNYDENSEYNNDARTLSFNIGCDKKEWIGDHRWMYACRSTTSPPKILICALMALEKWLSDKLDSDEEILQEINYLLNNSNSMAIIGVLLQLGKKSPKLFEQALIDLLSVPELFYYDIKHIISSENHQMMGYFNKSQLEVSTAKDWHLREYRKINLRDLLIISFVNSDNFRSNMQKIVIPQLDIWLSDKDKSHLCYDLAVNLVSQFSIINWEFSSDHKDQRQITYTPPDKQLQSTEASAAELTIEMINIPFQCRDLLDKNTVPHLKSFTPYIEKYAHIKSESQDTETRLMLAHAQCGLAAVLFKYKCELKELWVIHEDWCYEILLGTVFNPPKEQFNCPESKFSNGWDRFCADVLPIMWNEEQDNQDIRAAIAKLCSSLQLETIDHLVRSAANFRVNLGNNFHQLLHFLTLISSYKVRLSISKNNHHGNERLSTDQLNHEFNSYYEAFIESSISSKTPQLRSLDATFSNALHPHEQYGAISIRPRSSGLDLEIIKSSYNWLPALNNAKSHIERSFTLDFWLQCIDIICWQISDESIIYNRIDGTPYDFDRWVFSNLPKVILSCESTEEAQKLWQPILKLGPIAHNWIDDFYYEWFSLLTNTTTDNNKFKKHWNEAIEFSLLNDHWNRKIHHSSDFVKSLLGLDSLIINFIWINDFSSILQGFENHFEKYISTCNTSYELESIINFLLTNSAKEIRLEAIIWIDLTLNNNDVYLNHDIDNSITRLIKLILESYTGNIKNIPENTKKAVLRILKSLAERKNTLAMVMIEKYFS